MPSITLAGALLSLASPDDDGAWAWQSWRSITNLDIPPYAAKVQSGVIDSFTTKDLQNIRAFATEYWNLNESARAAFIKKRKDNNAAGRDAWCTFVNKHWQGDWKVNDLITDALNSNGCGPYEIMMRFKTSDVCILILFIAAYSRIIIVA